MNWKNRELQKDYFTVYKVTNLVNGMIYVGFHSTNNINDSYLGSGKYLKRAVNKYGKENFEKEIIAVFNNQEEAETLEREIVNEEFIKRKDTYNISVGGNVCILYGEDNGFYGKKHTPETIEKMQETRGVVRHTKESIQKIKESLDIYWSDEENRKAAGDRVRGREHKDETKEKIKNTNKITWSNSDLLQKHSELFKGRIVSEETRKKMSESQRKRFDNMTPEEYEQWYNETFTEERNKKLSESHKGKKCPWNQIINRDLEKIRKTAETHTGMKRSEETRKKMSEAKKGRKISKDVRKNMSKAQKGKRWMNKDRQVKMVYPNDIDSFIEDGWKFGRSVDASKL